MSISEKQIRAIAQHVRQIVFQFAGQPMTSDERKQHIDLLKSAADFNQKWLANIESVLNDEQKKLWRIKYRRTLHPVGGAGL